MCVSLFTISAISQLFCLFNMYKFKHLQMHASFTEAKNRYYWKYVIMRYLFANLHGLGTVK